MKILCLHGFGTNPGIMKRQMSVLIKHCDPRWQFHFLEGKVECPGAPGVEAIPGPYLCWSLDYGPLSIRAALDLIHETFQIEGPFDGVFGFSQGAAIIAAYLLEQADLYPSRPLPVRFGIFCCSTPILTADPDYIYNLYGTLSDEDIRRLRSGECDQIAQLPDSVRPAAIVLVEGLAAMEPVHGKPLSYFLDRPFSEIPGVVLPDQYKPRLSIPTLHIYGKDDPRSLKESCIFNAAFCDPRGRKFYRHSTIHNIPRSPTDGKEVVSLMESMVSHSQRSRL
ncbi:serine hydrolase FSH [Aspergillus pseudonomiae]|nr:serine hydrolase FSH [Aspergillus pseudonomiae]